jgi:hypothetical protein
MDSPTGPTFASVDVAPTGGWQNWTTVSTPLTNVPQGTHTLYVVFTHPTDAGGLMNLNWFQVYGKGAAVSAPPDVTATATPETGQMPLEVKFNATATDPEGEALTDVHLRERRQLHGQGHGHRCPGHQGQHDRQRARHRRAQPVRPERQVG